MNENTLMVTVRCLAYNHKPYIRQCLEGFVMQKTRFRFEAIVHDDASTDGTADIIKEYASKYPHTIKPILEKENQYSKHDGSLAKIINAHTHGKYIAICEGDDYWIDPYKLQKQVDFLEAHPDYGLIRTNINEYYQADKTFVNDYFSQEDCYQKRNNDSHEDYVMYGWFAAPCTWMYRSLYLKKISEFRNKYPSKGIFKGDLLVLLLISKFSKIKYINDTTAVYRILENSASHHKDNKKLLKFWLSVYRLRSIFAKKMGFKFSFKFYKISFKNYVIYKLNTLK